MTPDERAYLHSLWFNEGVVSIELLSDWMDHKKTELLHYYVETKIVDDFYEFFMARPVLCSYGPFPEYDIKLDNNKTVEIKISSYEGNTVFVETEKLTQGEWTPSGLTLSEADYYVFLQPGLVKKDEPISMKVRILPTEELISLSKILKIHTQTNSKGFYVDFGTLKNDGWVGSYPYFPETKQFSLKQPQRAYTNIKNMKKENA